MKNSFGFTLVEVLIASIVGVMLIGVVIQNYLSAKNIYNTQNEIAYFNEDVRFISLFLQQNITHAGFAGCRRISELELDNNTDIDFRILNNIYGYDSAQVQQNLDLAKNKIAPNTDVIIITKANSGITNLTENVNADEVLIKVKQNPVTEANPYILISDCKNADLVIAEKSTAKIIRLKSKLKHSYLARTASVSQFEELAFFISKTDRQTRKKQPIYSLYYSVNHRAKQELIPEIKDMQILYGVGALQLKATEITNSNLWDKVLGVTITLTPQNKLLKLKSWKIYIKLRERIQE